MARTSFPIFAALLLFAGTRVLAAGPEEGWWELSAARAVLAATREVRLAPDLEGLGPGEREALGKLVAAGRILQTLYEDSRHPEALVARARLGSLPAGPQRAALEALYYLFQGPVATTLDNRREPFLPVAPPEPGRNVYPWGLTTGTLDAWLARHPGDAAALLAPRTVVRQASDSLAQDLATIHGHPGLDLLHPGLRARLLRHAAPGERFYGLPYSLRWPAELLRAHDLLNEAAAAVAGEDPDLSDYLEQRARDLLTDDYEAGDAAWVSGDFRNLNAQIGSYETYDDALYGVKTFFGMSILVRDPGRSAELARALAGMQRIQDSLPMETGRKVRDDIPVGVYNVVADFGQARGANTATILPNEPAHTRKYGRTILLRYNIMSHPQLFADSLAVYRAAVAPEIADDYTIEGAFQGTLWHEVGHYLGVDRARDGRDPAAAIAPWGDVFEEMKSDLLSHFIARHLEAEGLVDAATRRAMYAAGVRRVLLQAQPRRDQPYQLMELMQFNFFLERGLLACRDDGLLAVDYARYHEVVEAMLGEVLAIQSAGDSGRAGAFVEKYTRWDPALHGRLASRIRDATPWRFRMVRYAILEQAAGD